MSQDLYFYKQKILTDSATKILSEEEIYEAIKASLAKRNLDQETSVREQLFEEVELDSLQISAYYPEINTLLEKDIKFINPQSRFFMINENMWMAIKSYIISDYIKTDNDIKIPPENSNEIDQLIKKLENKNPEINHDYSKLKNLYNKKMLFVNIQ